MYPPKTSERQASTSDSTPLGSLALGSSFPVVSFSGSSPSPLAHRGRIRDCVRVGSRVHKIKFRQIVSKSTNLVKILQCDTGQLLYPVRLSSATGREVGF